MAEAKVPRKLSRELSILAVFRKKNLRQEIQRGSVCPVLEGLREQKARAMDGIKKENQERLPIFTGVG